MTNHFLFMSYSFPIQVLIHFSFIPIHSLFILAPFISKVVQKKELEMKGNEMKWTKRKRKQMQPMIQSRILSPIHLPIQNPAHNPQYIYQ